jgi:ergothioneine biosynthesis protein EgtB
MSTTERPTSDIATLVQAYTATRKASETFAAPLAIEDYMLQAMDDVSPTKWHLAHVSWFFETFLLKPYLSGYKPLEERYEYLFNSYYNTVGPQYDRPSRGLISRPTVAEVYAYRKHVDDHMLALFEQASPAVAEEIAPLVELGVNHEQQHQELMVTDLKYNLAINPFRPAYHDRVIPRGVATPALSWVEHVGGVVQTGWDAAGFAFDHESPRHDTLLHPHRIASRLVTNGEYLAFIADGGYQRHELWLSQGWAKVNAEGWKAPLYWEQIDGEWWHYTLSGMQKVDEHAPVVHVSYLEADAYAGWAGKRLPSEDEWEHHAEGLAIEGNFADDRLYHPLPLDTGHAAPAGELAQMYGDVWEWTSSAFLQYPGFTPLEGGPGEYNGKFMMSQMVLRGGSVATPQNHMRTTYRNFFYPPDRWQFKGFRLAEDVR